MIFLSLRSRLSVSLLTAVLFVAGFLALTLNEAEAADYNVTAASIDTAYTINSVGGNPTLTLVRGQTYSFNIDACPCHPFQINGAPEGSVVNNNVAQGTIIFTVPLTAANYTYICSIHRFGGTINTIAPPATPITTTAAASTITSAKATLQATVNPNGQATTASFIYGQDAALAAGAQTTADQPVGSGSTGQAVSAILGGLQPATTYYFRAQATNPDGTTQGGILSFTTLSNNASLSGLVLGSGTLSPAFAGGTTSYAASVSSATASITVTPTAAQAGASIKVNNTATASGAAASVTLDLGPNTITVLVKAEDPDVTKSYTVTVMRGTNLDYWRQTHYPGSTSGTGPGADNATPLNDGVSNLMKYATGMDPDRPGTMPGTTGRSGGNVTFTYTPAAAAVADGVTFVVEYNDSLSPLGWASDIVSQGSIGAGGSPVTATVPEGTAGYRFLHLKVVPPP